MQAETKKELREVKRAVFYALKDNPETRNDDNLLYYTVCKEWATLNGLDISTLHFSSVFLGNPFGFPRFESVVRLRRMVQRAYPELISEKTAKGRKLKEADFVKYARQNRR